MAEARAPETAEVVITEARALEVAKAIVMAARPSVQEAEMQAAEASVVPLELETRSLGKSRAEEATASGKALTGQLGVEESAHRLTKGALNEAIAAVEASQIEAVVLKGTVEELGSEASRAAEASRFEAQRLKEKAEACQAETRCWEQKAKESEAEIIRAAEASSTVQTVLETEIGEHEALKRAALSACEALEVEGVQSGSSLGSRLIVLSSQMHERL
ncbi:uncharacterized protein [Miscanthus floridulus]|uniref:uncharacterized protein n=1 Tax=Miscanthus floridulus TaxID=154761 RepID=UPI0034598471